MTTTLHSSMEGDDLHIPWRTFADDAARLAHTIVAGDESFMFYVIATNEMWTIKNGAWSPPEVPAQYAGANDSQYTQASPRRITMGGTSSLTIDATSGIQQNLLTTDIWNNSTHRLLAPLPGKVIAVRLSMNVRPVANNNNARLLCSLDIGGSQNVIDVATESIYRGTSEWQPVRFSFPTLFQGATFVANGGELLLEPVLVDMDIADVQLLVERS